MHQPLLPSKIEMLGVMYMLQRRFGKRYGRELPAVCKMTNANVTEPDERA